jgi:lysophospholipase L1-like esterase
VKIILIVIAGVFGFFIFLEGGLRWFFGLGDPLLYIIDEEIGYLLKPNQKVRRFGNQIIINQYSMRGADFSPKLDDSTLRVLLLGDSIANGGWWTDQKQTISSLIQEQLQSSLIPNSRFKRIEVLNASANSWGPRNELAYLKKFGLFESQVIILLLNTDDLFGKTPSSLVVGSDRNYPAKKPPLALIELYNYYFKSSTVKEIDETGDRVGFNLTAIGEINNIAVQSNAILMVGMTPLLRELEEGSRDYEQKARLRLRDFLQDQFIIYLDFLPSFKEVDSFSSLYRDHIHLSPKGNDLVRDSLVNQLYLVRGSN